MFELQPLRLDHESAILDFEVTNRGYFAQYISDRGDEFFEQFAIRHRELLGDQEKGLGAFYVLVDDVNNVVGRFNLYELTNVTAEVGYRVAQRVSGHGVATAALRDLCRIARDELGLRSLSAKTNDHNVASQRVLEVAGFVPVGRTKIGAHDAQLYERVLTGS